MAGGGLDVIFSGGLRFWCEMWFMYFYIALMPVNDQARSMISRASASSEQ